jgi:hypothetical protein
MKSTYSFSHQFGVIVVTLIATASVLFGWVRQSQAADYFVTNTADSGPGSLREAILAANTNRTFCATIKFNIDASTDPGCDPSTGVCTIMPLSELPTMAICTTIDGYTQPGASTNSLPNGDNAVLKIVLNGSMAGSFVSGIVTTNHQMRVAGLVINQFSGSGIETRLFGSISVSGCFIGTDVSGTTAMGNGSGVSASGTIGGSSPDSRNVISGNLHNGVNMFAGSVYGSFIGTDRHGTSALGNSGIGVFGGRGKCSHW